MANSKHGENKQPRWKHWLGVLGPGLTAGAADDDPSGIATYSVVGAQYGNAFLWLAFATWPLMACVQMTCARVGMVSGQGLGAALKKKLPTAIAALLAFALFTANAINIAADLAGMGEAMSMLHLGPALLYVVAFGTALAFLGVRLPYASIARWLKWLALALLAYVITAFLAKPEWSRIAHDVLRPPLPFRKGCLAGARRDSRHHHQSVPVLLASRPGNRRAERGWQKHPSGAHQRVARRTHRSPRGCGSRHVCFQRRHVLHHPHRIADAPRAREPRTSRRRRTRLKRCDPLPDSGLICFSPSGWWEQACSPFRHWRARRPTHSQKHSRGVTDLNEKFARAVPFYAVYIASIAGGVVLDLVGVSAVKALVWSAVINGLLAPIGLAALVAVVVDKKLMKDQPSPNVMVGVVSLTAL